MPFLMKAGKGLDERMAEVRVKFKPKPYNSLMQQPHEVSAAAPDETGISGDSRLGGGLGLAVRIAEWVGVESALRCGEALGAQCTVVWA